MKTKYLALASLAAGPLLLLSAGCAQRITGDSVRANMSPEIESIAETPQQRKNKVARAADETASLINNDWDRFWLLDRPGRMSTYPMPQR